MDKEKPVAPLLHDLGGPIYNPRVALGLFERMAAGEADLLKDEKLIRTMRRALVARYPAEPKFQPGKYGAKYDSYTCRNCGFGVNDPTYFVCPNCGQALTQAVHGRRATQEDEERFWDCRVLLAALAKATAPGEEAAEEAPHGGT